MLELMKHQVEVLEESKDLNKVAFYYDMGLGKTFIGAEKAVSLGKNILVVCQKSKVEDWYKHFLYNYHNYLVNDLTDKFLLELYLKWCNTSYVLNVGIINYDLVWRRPELSKLKDFTLILDESSLISNSTAKRTKFIIKKLKPTNVILLSGTPVSGKYEDLVSQMNLLGWNITNRLFESQYCVKEFIKRRNGELLLSPSGFPVKKIVGYKNVERLRAKMREYGCFFKKTEEVIDLPEQRFISLKINPTNAYKKFLKNGIVSFKGKEFIGDTPLNKRLNLRLLSSAYNDDKLQALKDLIESTNDRIVIFYNFNVELEKIKTVIPDDRPISYINGSVKDLTNYDECENSITLCQYQSGSMGHNLQKSNKIIYFSPTQSSDLFEQSKKRIHRIGQKNNCLYYKLVSGIEENIYKALDTKRDYTDALFEEEFGG